MRIIAAATITLAVALAFSAAPTAQNGPPVTNAPGIPGWAYPVAAGVPGPKDDGTVYHVPNSTVGMTLTQARNNSDVPDWHPDEHLPMPDVVRRGRVAEGVRACGYCHYPEWSRTSGEREHRRSADRVLHPAGERLQEWSPEVVRAEHASAAVDDRHGEKSHRCRHSDRGRILRQLEIEAVDQSG
jgi:hypothetical protein